MAMVSVRLPQALAERAGAGPEVTVEATDVSGALAALGGRYPEVARLLYASDGSVRPFVNVFLGDRAVTGDPDAGESVAPGDELRIVPSIAGG